MSAQRFKAIIDPFPACFAASVQIDFPDSPPADLLAANLAAGPFSLNNDSAIYSNHLSHLDLTRKCLMNVVYFGN